MLRRGQPITFRGLAQTAGVSLDFLYRHPEMRRRVEQLRAQQQTARLAPERADDADQPSSVVRTLTAQLAELKRRHREETQPSNRPSRPAFGWITFYGTSYGTELGQYLMRQHPANLRAVVLDAVVPTQFNLVTQVSSVKQRIAQKYFQGCEREAACREAYPDLARRLPHTTRPLRSTAGAAADAQPKNPRKNTPP